MAALLFLAFLIIPLIEIGIFIQVGGMLGLWPTLALIVVTAVVGSFIIRLQGFGVLNKARSSLAQAELPVEPLIHGLFLVIAGALLITPGFFTDAMGFSLLVPPVRIWLGRSLFRYIQEKGRVEIRDINPNGPNGRGGRDETIIIEGEAEDITGWDKDSPWRSDR